MMAGACFESFRRGDDARSCFRGAALDSRSANCVEDNPQHSYSRLGPQAPCRTCGVKCGGAGANRPFSASAHAPRSLRLPRGQGQGTHARTHTELSPSPASRQIILSIPGRLAHLRSLSFSRPSIHPSILILRRMPHLAPAPGLLWAALPS